MKNGKSATDAAPKISGYTYTSGGEADVETKADAAGQVSCLVIDLELLSRGELVTDGERAD